MITIKVDLTSATPAEAEAYSASKTRLFLLYASALDLKGIDLTIGTDSGSHFQRRLSEEEVRTGIVEPDIFCTERSPAHAKEVLLDWLKREAF